MIRTDGYRSQSSNWQWRRRLISSTCIYGTSEIRRLTQTSEKPGSGGGYTSTTSCVHSAPQHEFPLIVEPVLHLEGRQIQKHRIELGELAAAIKAWHATGTQRDSSHTDQS